MLYRRHLVTIHPSDARLTDHLTTLSSSVLDLFHFFNKLTASFVPALSISTSLAMKLSIYFTKIDIVQKSKPLLILFTILLNSTLSVWNITLSVLRCQAGKHHATWRQVIVLTSYYHMHGMYSCTLLGGRVMVGG